MPEHPKMTSPELIEEVDWLLSFDLHPEHIARQVGRSMVAIEMVARNHGAAHISRIFNRAIKKVWPEKDAA